MVQVQHITFKDWNPIGKPRQKTHENSGNSPGSVKNGFLETAQRMLLFPFKRHMG
ncbi:MAG: hypothetical protein K2I96_25050 [Lachnospiraceae bacterium]|nr:hypothetical protein [Lachnospiraceae bacterium]